MQQHLAIADKFQNTFKYDARKFYFFYYIKEIVFAAIRLAVSRSLFHIAFNALSSVLRKILLQRSASSISEVSS